MRSAHKQYIMPSVARALKAWPVLSSDGAFDGRLHFFMLASGAIKPSTLPEFAAPPFVEIAAHAIDLLAEPEEKFRLALGGAELGQARLLLINILHRLVDLEEVQLALWAKESALGRVVAMHLSSRPDDNNAMDLLDIFIEMGKAGDGTHVRLLWAVPGLAEELVKIARKTAFERSNGQGAPGVTSRHLALGCLANMANDHTKQAWKSGLLDAALIALRSLDDDRLQERARSILSCLSEDLDGLRKHATQPLSSALFKQVKEMAKLPQETRSLLLRMEQRLGTLEKARERATAQGLGGAALLHACHACSRQETADTKFAACSRCKCTFYCSRECQRKDWKNHKVECRSAQQAQAQTASQRNGRSKSIEMLSSEFFNANVGPLAMRAEAEGISLDEIVFLADFADAHPDGKPAVRLFKESEAAEKLKVYEWWGGSAARTLATYTQKRRDLADDKCLQFVHLCLFEGNQLFGGRYIVPEEHTERLRAFMRSADGQRMRNEMKVAHDRMLIDRIAKAFEEGRLRGPLADAQD